jgi:ATP-dependent exoDNAse (exonuclease V) beta subunit
LLTEPALLRLAPVLEEIRRLPPARYLEDQWTVLQDLVELLRLTVAELLLVFAERGQVDFAEVALRALAALQQEGTPSDLLLRLDTQINHILVDEFQDTSYLQTALLEQLTEGWQPGDGRTLFVVGDPMQSIYRFREAEVGLFLRAQRTGIGSVSLEPLQLSTNFRSQAGLLDWVNGAFPGLFPREEDVARGAVRYAPTTAFHPPQPGLAVQVHPHIGRDDDGEARAVVDLVCAALHRGDDSVAILVRSRSHLAAILPALRNAGLRYLARDIDLLAERTVARDLIALTRALLHAGDRLSWLSLLRAPWCGLSLDDLHALCWDRRDQSIPQLLAEEEVVNRLSRDGKTRVERVFPLLQHARRQLGRVGLRRLVEGCWLSLGGPACCGGSGLDDAARVFDLLAGLDVGGDLLSLASLEEGLEQLYAAPDAGADGRLQVMTMHKAKGLEFDTVILPGLGRAPARGEPALLRWLEYPGCGLLLAPIAPRDGSSDPVYDAIGRLENDKEALETVRLLYVAATRARHRLHLLGHAETVPGGPPRPVPGALLAKLWPALAASFSEQRSSLAPGALAAGIGENPPRLRRLTLDRQFPAPAPAPLPPGIGEGAPAPGERAVLKDLLGLPNQAARYAGTVLHRLLERVGRDGIKNWSRSRVAGLRVEVEQRLMREGVPRGEVELWSDHVLQGLDLAVTGERGRWILEKRADDACELPVSSAEISLGIIDRTFVEAGQRWLIDYKTSLPKDGEAQRFYADMSERYRPQLVSYGRIFAALEPDRPLRAGLYFPLFDGWCEVSLEL